MKTKMRIALLLAVMCLAFGAFAACQPSDATYSVLFIKNTQEAVENMPTSHERVQKGALIPIPNKTPTLYNHVFGGWYKDGNCETPWSFETDTVQARTLLYAKWTHVSQMQCTVTFHANLMYAGQDIVHSYYVGNLPVQVTNLNKGSTISVPTLVPYLFLKTDSSSTAVQGVADFDGWFTESECQTEFIFDSDAVNENTTLYAKWVVSDSFAPSQAS